MKSVYNKSDLLEIIARLDKISTGSERQWGTMGPAQMLAHCTEALKIPAGESKPPRLFLGRIIGSAIKNIALSEKPFRKNSPTDPSFVIKEEKDVNQEREKLKSLLEKFHQAGIEKCSDHPHTFFGKLTPEEWGVLGYKHLDHHLRQFGC